MSIDIDTISVIIAKCLTLEVKEDVVRKMPIIRYYVKAWVDSQRRVLASLGADLPLAAADDYSLAIHKENQRRMILRSAAGDHSFAKVPKIESS